MSQISEKGLKTGHRLTVATLGQLVAEAKARGIALQRDDGFPYYPLKVDGDRIKIGSAKVENREAALTLRRLAESAIAAGIAKVFKDAKGVEFIAFDFDLKKGTVETVTPTDANMKIAKAISPKREKK